MGYEFFERKSAAQTVLVVDDIDIIDLVHVLGLHPHLLYALGHAPVFVYHNHFRTHQTAGRILVILQKVDDVAGLLYVVDVAENLLAVILVKLLNNVDRIIRIKVFDLLGDIGHIHLREKLGSVVLVKLHEHIGLHLLVKKLEEIFGLIEIEILIKLRDVGRMEVGKFLGSGRIGTVMDNFTQVCEIFGGEFFHYRRVRSEGWKIRLLLAYLDEPTRFVRSMNCATESCSGRRERSGSSGNGTPAGNIPRIELRIVLRRCPKAVFTTDLNSRSSHPRSVTLLRTILITPLLTLGGGLNTFSSTVKRYSTSYHA